MYRQSRAQSSEPVMIPQIRWKWMMKLIDSSTCPVPLKNFDEAPVNRSNRATRIAMMTFNAQGVF